MSVAGNDPGDFREYDPNLLDDPQWPCGKHKRVLIFPSYMVRITNVCFFVFFSQPHPTTTIRIMIPIFENLSAVFFKIGRFQKVLLNEVTRRPAAIMLQRFV